MRGLSVLIGLSLLFVSGCGRATTKPAPEPNRIEALVRARVRTPPSHAHVNALVESGATEPAPVQGDTRGVPRSDADRATWRKAQEDDIYEAVLRQGFEVYAFVWGGNDDDREAARRLERCTFFLWIKGKDPSNQFMGRFAGARPVVKKGSEAKRAGGAPSPARKVGEVAAMAMGDISWTSDTSVAVEWSWRVSQRSAGGFEKCVVVRENGRWVVKQLNWPFAV
jgi:hypothetical protein